METFRIKSYTKKNHFMHLFGGMDQEYPSLVRNLLVLIKNRVYFALEHNLENIAAQRSRSDFFSFSRKKLDFLDLLSWLRPRESEWTNKGGGYLSSSWGLVGALGSSWVRVDKARGSGSWVRLVGKARG